MKIFFIISLTLTFITITLAIISITFYVLREKNAGYLLLDLGKKKQKKILLFLGVSNQTELITQIDGKI